jgi:acyl carrier protein
VGWIDNLLKRAQDEKAPAGPPPSDEEVAGPEAPTTGSHTHEDILMGLRAHLVTTARNGGRKLDDAGIVTDVDLYEAGYLDSLTASEFLVMAEKQFGVHLPDWLIGGQANTLDSLAGYIATQLSS